MMAVCLPNISMPATVKPSLPAWLSSRHAPSCSSNLLSLIASQGWPILVELNRLRKPRIDALSRSPIFEPSTIRASGGVSSASNFLVRALVVTLVPALVGALEGVLPLVDRQLLPRG